MKKKSIINIILFIILPVSVFFILRYRHMIPALLFSGQEEIKTGKGDEGFKSSFFENWLTKKSGWEKGNQWCACFVSSCLKTTFKKTDICSKNSQNMMQKAKDKGIFSQKARPGDIFVFKHKTEVAGFDLPENENKGHVGFVLYKKGNTVKTLEGNAGNPGKVRFLSFDIEKGRDDFEFMGFINL